MSEFQQSLAALVGKKVRFYCGGGERGSVQGPVVRVEDDLVYVEKQGEIRGTMHAITLRAESILFYEIDTVTRQD
jgi:hypothetical protein